ncbi:hd family hydrolase [Fusarium albosuccineum]|uniref:5'-deoxynucleotidase n=1 Tax=Fusarium albosuccineum TaxID=1237068 RepID=A0A8H4LF28_9HYPO|nr:hd family hydrolase [Fusarium albosuccineum]
MFGSDSNPLPSKVKMSEEAPNDRPAGSSGEPWTVEKVLAGNDLVLGSGSPISFFHLLGRLKTTKREGWKRHGINPESVADHSYRMGMIALFAPQGIDQVKCMKMCLFHDIAESAVGDITPFSGVSKAEKGRREASTIEYIATRWSGPYTSEIRGLWHEFEAGETPEAQFAQDIDKIELLLQAVEYERNDKSQQRDLGEFMGVARKLRSEAGKTWADEILREREKFWEGRDHVRGEQAEKGGVSSEAQRLQDAYYA